MSIPRVLPLSNHARCAASEPRGGRPYDWPRVRFYVTTPIYYVNATPHIGHAYTTIAADILARHHRQRGEETFFLTGTDEHGSNIARVAEEAGLDPQEFVDRNAAVFREMTERVNASNDFFIRTTDARHEAARPGVRPADLRRRARSTRASTRGSTALGCEAFYTEAELVDGQVPAARDRPRVRRGEELLLPALRLSGPAARALRPEPGVRAAALPLQRGAQLHRAGARRHQRSAAPPSGGACPCRGIRTRSSTSGSTRSSTTGARSPSPARARTCGRASGRRCGTSSARTSSSSTASSGRRCSWPPGSRCPGSSFVHGYLLIDDRKMSKSLGNVIDPLELIDVYGVDPVRFYLLGHVRSGRTATSRSTACTSATSGSSATISATCSRERRRWSPATATAHLRWRRGLATARRRARRPRAERRAAARRVRPHRRARRDLGASCAR